MLVYILMLIAEIFVRKFYFYYSLIDIFHRYMILRNRCLLCMQSEGICR